MLSSLFIRRPRLAVVLSLLITVVGVVAIVQIPVAQYPTVAPPTIQVGASYPGASAETVEQTLAQPIETAVNGVPGMKYMKSVSSADGSYSLTVSFAVGTDPDMAAVAVQDRVSQVLPGMPTEVRQVGISVSKAAGDLLQVFALYSPDDSRDALFLSNLITLSMLDELKRIPGVGSASIFGQRDYAMRVWLNPERMNRLGLTVDEVLVALRSQNQQAAAGSIGTPPVPDGQVLQLPISVAGRLSSVAEFEAIVLRDDPTGGRVRLADVARVELGAAAQTSIARYEGHAAAAVGIYLAPGANAVTVAKAVSARMADLAQGLPSGVAYQMVLNGADFVDAMIETVLETLVIAFVLVSLVVFVFLGRLRASLIPLIAAPVAIIGGVAVLYALGFSANAITLLALVLAIGIVVDDAIIVTENVERVMEEDPHLTPVEATDKAMREITPSVIAITLVLLSVFVPVAFLPGSTGVLFQNFAVAVTAAVLVSAINALTLSPALAALVLRSGPPLAVMRRVSGAITAAGHGYALLVRRLLRVAVLGLVVIAGVVLASGWLMQHTPDGFVPDEDKGFLYVVMTLPAAAALERTDHAARTAEALLRADPAVEGVATVLGIDFLGGGSASNGGVFFVKLKDYDARTDPALSAFATIPRLRARLATLPEALFVVANPPAIDGLGRVGGIEYVLQGREGQSLADLSAVARGMAQATRTAPEVAGLFGAEGTDSPRVRLDIDRDRAQSLGIDLGGVFSTLQVMLGGSYVNDFSLFGRSWTVRLQADGAHRRAIDDILALQVKATTGEMVPLSAFATPHLELGPRAITRYDNYRAMVLTAAAAPGVGTGAAIAALERLSAETLPAGYGFAWTGQALEETEAAGRTGLILALAVLFAYLFLVGLYESWSVPVPVLLSVTVAALGALGALLVTGMAFDVYAQIGIVVLIALAAKNAILMVSFALERRAEGLDLPTATEDGARMRFRPVMMTSVAFIAGLVPLAIATGPGAAAMRAVGTPVLGGMLAASVIGIFTIPMLFLVVQGLRERLRRPAADDPARPTNRTGPPPSSPT